MIQAFKKEFSQYVNYIHRKIIQLTKALIGLDEGVQNE